MNKVRVGIIRGGANENYETSLKEGSKMISYLFENLPNKCTPIDIFVDKVGVWHIQGVPVLPFDLMHKVDVIWDTTSPALSQVLEGHILLFKIPHFAGSMASSKALLREHMKTIGVKMPMHIVLPAYQFDFDGLKEDYIFKKAQEVHQKFPSPWLVKSFSDEESMGIHVAKTFPELLNAIADGVEHNTSILIEELIEGQKMNTHLVKGFRDQDIYIFPINKIQKEEKNKLEDLSKKIYEHLGAEHYLNAHFILNKNKGIYLTDVSLYPDFSTDSILSSHCENIGAKTAHIFEHIIQKILK